MTAVVLRHLWVPEYPEVKVLFEEHTQCSELHHINNDLLQDLKNVFLYLQHKISHEHGLASTKIHLIYTTYFFTRKYFLSIIYIPGIVPETTGAMVKREVIAHTFTELVF